MEEETKENEEVAKEVIEGSELVDTNGINISEEVVATIAAMAASEVKGIVSMNANGIGDIFSRKTKGVKVVVGERETVIDINITVEYGARIPDVAFEVQQKVKSQVEMTTGLTVSKVNINVQGVSVRKNQPVEKPAEKPVEKIEEKPEEKSAEEVTTEE